VATQPDPGFRILFNWLGYLSISPSLSEILSHFELIPDAALTLMRNREIDIMTFNLNKKRLHWALNWQPAAYNSSTLTTTLQTAIYCKVVGKFGMTKSLSGF